MPSEQGENLAESDPVLVSCGKVIGTVEVHGEIIEIHCELPPDHVNAKDLIDRTCIGSATWWE